MFIEFFIFSGYYLITETFTLLTFTIIQWFCFSYISFCCQLHFLNLSLLQCRNYGQTRGVFKTLWSIYEQTFQKSLLIVFIKALLLVFHRVRNKPLYSKRWIYKKHYDAMGMQRRKTIYARNKNQISSQ